MTNPPYDPDPTIPSQPVSTGSGSYATEDYAAGGYVGTTDAGSPSTKDVAKNEAAKTKDTAVGAGKSVADTAKSEASGVAAEAKGQAKGLVGTVTSEVRGQVSTQQQRIAGTIKELASELGSMASKSGQTGPASNLAKQASQRVGQVAHWLESKEPADLLAELQSFGSRKPGLFLGLSALAGVLAGRVGRGAVAANTKLDSPESSTTTSSTYAATPSTYDTSYSTGTSTYETADTYASTSGAPRSMVEELPTSYEGTSSGYSSAAADREAGRGDVTR